MENKADSLYDGGARCKGKLEKRSPKVFEISIRFYPERFYWSVVIIYSYSAPGDKFYIILDRRPLFWLSILTNTSCDLLNSLHSKRSRSNRLHVPTFCSLSPIFARPECVNSVQTRTLATQATSSMNNKNWWLAPDFYPTHFCFSCISRSLKTKVILILLLNFSGNSSAFG